MTPILRFHRLHPDVRPPERADRAAGGTLPTRAFRYCEAVTSANAFGHYVFAPMDFSLLWDGQDIWWTCALLDDWALLTAAQLPDMAARFDAHAPVPLQGLSPPFLSALPEPGMVQVWSGLLARTAPGWSLQVRAPVNLPLPGGFTVYEGIVETDRWFGPLFANLRLTRTDTPVTLRADMPLLQVQPLPRAALTEAVHSATATSEIDALAGPDWTALAATLTPAATPGRYATAARKRARACPFHPA
jgi:hypothetical protein